MDWFVFLTKSESVLIYVVGFKTDFHEEFHEKPEEQATIIRITLPKDMYHEMARYTRPD